MALNAPPLGQIASPSTRTPALSIEESVGLARTFPLTRGRDPTNSYHPCRIHSSRSRDDRTRSVYSQSRPRSSATSRM